jgi:hypothetical protein
MYTPGVFTTYKHSTYMRTYPKEHILSAEIGDRR